MKSSCKLKRMVYCMPRICLPTLSAAIALGSIKQTLDWWGFILQPYLPALAVREYGRKLSFL